MFGFWNNYYYLEIVLQIVCILHALKTGRRDWLYLLIFLPFVGAIVYLVMEVLPSLRSGSINNNLRRSILPGGRIKELERKRKIADTETNRLLLAAEYARMNNFDKAIELTQSCMAGIYANNTGMMLDMARYSFGADKYAESLAWFDKVMAFKNNQLDKPEDELIYAKALHHNGELARAEEMFRRNIRVHHSLEAMYSYGKFLKENGREEEATQQFRAVLEEKDLHPKHVRRRNARWIMASRKALLVK